MSNHTTAEIKKIEIKDVVNSIQAGNGTPIILIHGLAASLHDWDDLIPALSAAGCHTFALDLLGHGESRKPASLEEYNIENVFHDFSEWIESLRLSQPLTLIGHSLGGYLALLYTVKHPERVSALVLCDPFYNLSQLPLLLRINFGHSHIISNVIEHLPVWLIKKIVDFTSLSIRNGYQMPDSVRWQTAEDYKRAQPGIFNIIHSLEDLSPCLYKITKPVLILWGAHDRTLSPESFRKILREIPNSTGIAIQAAGHVPHQSHPLEFNHHVINFLRTNSVI